MSEDKQEFIRQIRDALAHLYDTAHLQEHPLCRMFLSDMPLGAVSNAQALRRVLLDAIEQLRPSAHVPYGDREWRPYRVLFGRYVQRLPTLSVLDELAISDRQYQREHAKALRALTGFLGDRVDAGHTAGEGPSPASDSLEYPTGHRAFRERPTGRMAPSFGSNSLSTAVRTLVAGARPEALDGEELIRSAIEAVDRLASSRSVRVDLKYKASVALIYGDRGLLRQILLNILSYLLAQFASALPGAERTDAENETLSVLVESLNEEMHVTIARHPPHSTETIKLAKGASPRLDLSEQLVKAIGGRFWVEGETIHLGLPLQRKVLLVVDDNRDVIEMFKRFLADGRFKVLGAQTAEQALALAKETRPFLIMLDVMMPAHDGWEVLQSLKHNPATGDIPIVICSILDEPELALSLGADDYIRKPVTQKKLLHLLARWENGTAKAL